METFQFSQSRSCIGEYMKILSKRLRSVRKNIISALDSIVIDEKTKVPVTPEEQATVLELQKLLRDLKDKVDLYIGE